MSSDSNTAFVLSSLVHRAGRYLDDHDFDNYLSLYSDEGTYSIITKAPELPDPMIWMQQTKTELAERIQAMTEHEWEIALIEQTRIISVDIIERKDAAAAVSSSFVLYHTAPGGVTSCYAVGRYEDSWLMSAEGWLLTQREVVLKTRQLDVLSPLPI
jgi:3-phenylpropionate/cinnamic acid dioxygenase small subunit